MKRWRLNVIDAVALAGLVVGVAVMGIGYRTVQRVGPLPRRELGHAWVRLVMDVAPISPETAAHIHVGDTQTDAAGQAVARVYQVRRLRPYYVSTPVGGMPVVVHMNGAYALELGLEVLAQVSDTGLYYQDERRLHADNRLTFHARDYAIQGVIREVLGIGDQHIVTLVCPHVSTNVIQRLTIGDESWHVTPNDLAMTLTDIVSNTAGSREHVRALVVRLRLNTRSYDGRLYGGTFLLEPGMPLLFETSTYVLLGHIAHIQQDDQQP